MTEIPEHLLKRAQAAREKSAEAAPAAAAEPAAAEAAAPADSRIPEALLQRFQPRFPHRGHRFHLRQHGTSLMTDLTGDPRTFENCRNGSAQLLVGMGDHDPDIWDFRPAMARQFNLEWCTAPGATQGQPFPRKLFPVDPETGRAGRTGDNHANNLGGNFRLRRDVRSR